MSKNFVVFGGSKGLGDAFVQGLPEPGDTVYILSRSRPRAIDICMDDVTRIWLPIDLGHSAGVSQLTSELAGKVVDVLIYNVGIWEERGFEDDYNFDFDQPSAIETLIQTNVTAPIIYLQSLLPNIRKSANGKIILIGSTNGLENNNSPQVSFVASKFAIRGIAHALREHLRMDSVGVTCLNPGNLAAEIPYEEGQEKALRIYGGSRIPLQDMVQLVRSLLLLSPAACVKEIDIPAMQDENC